MSQLTHRLSTRGLPGLLIAKGIIEVANFPTEAKIGEPKPWNATVHNIGTDGRIAIGISNKAGNPGNIIITWKGEDIVLPPGYYLRIYTVNPQPNCYRTAQSGTVTFPALGNYNIDILALHEENTSWIVDHLRPFLVSVTEPPPPPEEPSLWEQIEEWWGNRSGIEKAVIVGTPTLVVAVVTVKPQKLLKQRA